jgi:hypothetical protein
VYRRDSLQSVVSRSLSHLGGGGFRPSDMDSHPAPRWGPWSGHYVLGSSPGYRRCQFLQAHSGIVPRLGHDCFLPDPFQSIIHPKYRPTVFTSPGTQSVVEGACRCVGALYGSEGLHALSVRSPLKCRREMSGVRSLEEFIVRYST